MTSSVVVETMGSADVLAVLALVDDVYDAAGVPPLSDQALLELRRVGADGASPGVKHLVGRLAGADAMLLDPSSRFIDKSVVGYLQLVDDGASTVGELVVAPVARRNGVGSALARLALDGLQPGRTARAWAHGNAASAAAFATALGFYPARVLFQMGRGAELALPAVREPAGVRIRTFRPGEDDDAWVRVNARAFADHPEQGRLTVADLRERMAEEWFDPAGFFVAERSAGDGAGPGGLVGFHWTKVHTRPTPAGEVYAVGVDPSEQGTGLGLALTVTGLAHLVSLGVPHLMLYADESNAGAVRMYERLGFAVTATDVMYER